MTRLLRLFNLQSRDRAFLVAFTPVFVLVTAANVVTVSFAKSLSISSNEVSALPMMFIGASLFTALAALTYVGLSGRSRPGRRFDLLFLLAIFSFAGLGTIVDLHPPTVSLVIYAWSTGIGQLLIIQTWAYTATITPTRSARRLFPVFAAAATLGAAAGGFLTRGLLDIIGFGGLIYVSVALLIATLATMRWAIRRLDSAPEATSTDTHRGLAQPTVVDPETQASNGKLAHIRFAFLTLRKYPLMASIAAMVFFTQLASVTLDFQFSVALKAEFDGEKMAAFFGVYYGAASLLSLLMGLLGGSRLTRSIGIGLAAAAAAAMLLLGSASALFLYASGVTTLLWPIVAASFGERVLSFGVSKPAMQAAFTPVPPRAVEAGKFIIDGVVYRFATLSVSVALLIWAGDLVDYGKLSPLVIIFACVAVFIGLNLGRRYRQTLFSGLRQRRVATDDAHAPWAERDARTVVQTLLAGEHADDVLQGLELARELRIRPPMKLFEALVRHEEPLVAIDVFDTLTTLNLSPSPTLVRALFEDTTTTDPGVIRSAIRALPRGQLPRDSEYLTLVPKIEELTHHPDAAIASLAFVWLRTSAKSPPGTARLLTYELRLMRDLASDDNEVAKGAIQQVASLHRDEYIAPLLDSLIRPGLRPTVFENLREFTRSNVFAQVNKRLKPDSGLSDIERVWLLRLAESLKGPEAVAAIAPHVSSSSDVLKDQAAMSLWHLDRMGLEVDRDVVLAAAAFEVDALLRLALFDRIVRTALAAGPKKSLLRREVALRRSRGERRCFRLLGVLYDGRAVERAHLGYRDASIRTRSNAIELLDALVIDTELRDFIAYIESSERVDGTTQTTTTASNALTQKFSRILADKETSDPEADDALTTLGVEGRRGWIGDVYRWARSPDALTHGRTQAANDRWKRLLLLTRVDLFRRVPAKDLEPISALAIPTRFRPGDVLCRQGAAATDMFLLVDGEVEVFTAERGRIAILRGGECVGEMGVLDPAPRSATVRAMSPITALRLDQADLQDLLELFPAVSRGIIDVLTQRLRASQALERARKTAA